MSVFGRDIDGLFMANSECRATACSFDIWRQTTIASMTCSSYRSFVVNRTNAALRCLLDRDQISEVLPRAQISWTRRMPLPSRQFPQRDCVPTPSASWCPLLFAAV